MESSKSFTRSDLDRISTAVKEAEKRTSGEIVPYVVDRSDPYAAAEWRGGVVSGVAMLVAFVVEQKLYHSWSELDLLQVTFACIVAFLAGALVVRYIPFCRRLLAGRAEMDRRVHQRATEAFVSEEVFNTRERAGVLIFLSLFERKVVVLGDSGINAKVKQSDWGEIVRLIVEGIHAKRPADGLVEAIARCGKLLEKEGVAIRPDDADELTGDLRLGSLPD